MTEEKKLVIASAYFASDKVIFAVRDDGAATGFRVDKVDAAGESVPDDQKMEEDLHSAVEGIKNLLTHTEKLRAVVLICPGPFRRRLTKIATYMAKYLTMQKCAIGVKKMQSNFSENV